MGGASDGGGGAALGGLVGIVVGAAESATTGLAVGIGLGVGAFVGPPQAATATSSTHPTVTRRMDAPVIIGSLGAAERRPRPNAF